MATAVEMEQLADTWARLAAAPMAAPRPLLRHEAGGLEGLFHEGIAEREAMLAAGEAMKVPHVEPLIVLAVEGEQALDLGDGRPFRGGRLPTAIEQPVIAEVFQPPAQSPNAAGTATKKVGGLEPGELAVESSNNDLLDFHGALHGAGRIGHGHLLGSHSCPQRQRERSFHVSIPAAKSRTPYKVIFRY